MQFRIADTFTDSLARLTGEEQKAVKTTVFDLQVNPEAPGLSFHKLDRAKDKCFWSVRVNKDVRIIVHRAEGSLLLCYVDHHDHAYSWAERRKLDVHPTTGAAQFVEIRETVKEVFIPVHVPVPTAPTKESPRVLFATVPESELLRYGVPPEWLDDVRKVDEDGLLALAPHLPAEAAEALLELAVGGAPRVPAPATPTTSPFDHPDAQRRFRLMTNVEALKRALDYPWEKWTIFLHPDQKSWVERDFNGPSRVSGSAGTGKTIVALHRAVHLLRTNPEARVLLTTFSDPLANALHTRVKRLIGNEPRLGERIDVLSLPAVGLRLHRSNVGPATIASRNDVVDAIKTARAAVPGHKFELRFLATEWDQVVDAWQIDTWDAYRDVARLGRKTRLPEAQRKVLWSIFEVVRAGLKARSLVTEAQTFTAVAAELSKKANLPYDFAVVDEAQDIGVAHLRFFAALGAGRPNALFFAGDLGQRIFQQPFSWKSLGVDVRGRSRTLRVNYRTSHQIRSQADRLLAESVTDVDGETERRDDAISVFNGPPPTVASFKTNEDEIAAVAKWLKECASAGVLPHEFGVFVRSAAQLDRAKAAVEAAGIPMRVLDGRMEVASGHVSVSEMHAAKGLEFRAVAVMAVDDEVIPLQERIETVGEEADLQEVYDTERHLLYVACTRARDHLLITCVEPASEFLADMRSPETRADGRPARSAPLR